MDTKNNTKKEDFSNKEMTKKMFNKKTLENNYPQIPINTPLEYLAYKIPRKSFALVLLAIGGTIGTVGLALITIFLLGQTNPINILIQLIQITLSILFLLIATTIYQNSIKRGDNIIIREHRGGVMTFDKQNINKKIYFDNKDPSTEITVLWNGTATEKQSGAKIVLIKEGSKSNENINLCVSETDWSKNLGAMVRAKTFADIAENELLNTQNLLGLKWQDIAIILITILAIGIIIIQLGITPDMVAKNVTDRLLDGALQHAVQSVITKGGA